MTKPLQPLKRFSANRSKFSLYVLYKISRKEKGKWTAFSARLPTVHILMIPKEHIASADDLTEENAQIVAHIFTVAKKIAAAEGLTNGYRIVNNCGEDGGQTVKHLHFHLLGGRSMAWPPG